MPQVASEATSAAFKPAPPTLMRPAPSAEGAPDLPFESLLDTNTQAAPAPPQAPQASQPPQSPPATPDRGPQKATGSSAAETDGKASRKSDGKTADKTTGKVTDKSTVKTANPAQPLPAERPVDPNEDEATQTTGNITIVKTTDANKAVQAPVQAAVQPVLQTVDDANTSDAANAIASAATPLAPKNLGDAKAKVDAKMDETIKAADTANQADDKTADDKAAADAKATGDAKTAASPVPVIVATDPTAPPVQTATTAAPMLTTPEHATVIVPVTTEVSQIAPLAKQAAAAAPKPTAAPKTTAGEFAALQDGADKAAAARTHDETPAAVPDIAADKPAPVATDAQAALPKTTGDAVQQFSLPTPTPDLIQAVTPATVPTAPAAPIAAPAAPVPIAGVAIEIATQAQAGKNHFEIRLDPPELGRIEVRLDVDRDGHVTSRLIADRSDTLNMLRNDAAGLQRALQDAGLKTTDNGLQFSLRDQSMNQQQNAAPSTPNTTQIVVQDSTLPAGEAAQRNYSRLAGLRGGIDIRV